MRTAPTWATFCPRWQASRKWKRWPWSILPAPQDGAGQLIQIRLKYTEDRRSAISGLRRVSRPGQRTYVDAKHIPKVLGGMGTAIVSTSHGVMTGHDARAEGVGGEVLAQVW